MNDHARWNDTAAAYVLDAMAVAEREEFEVHLSTCAACREEVDELRPAAEALPMASPLMEPPPQLKDRIMVEVEREASLLGAAGAGADRPERTERRPPPVLAQRLAARAGRRRAADRRRAGRRRSLSGPDSRTIPATVEVAGASAELEIDGDKAMLVAENLPAPPEGRVFEVWVMPKGSDTPRAHRRAVHAAGRRLGRGRDPRVGRRHQAGPGHRRAARRLRGADRRAADGR